MSVLEQSYWPQIRPYMRMEVYTRDGGRAHARVRFELDPPTTALGKAWAALTMPCVACYRTIQPFRARRGQFKRGSAKHMFYACTCSLDVNVGCSRGNEARDEYQRVRKDLEQRPTTPTLTAGRFTW